MSTRCSTKARQVHAGMITELQTSLNEGDAQRLRILVEKRVDGYHQGDVGSAMT